MIFIFFCNFLIDVYFVYVSNKLYLFAFGVLIKWYLPLLFYALKIIFYNIYLQEIFSFKF